MFTLLVMSRDLERQVAGATLGNEEKTLRKAVALVEQGEEEPVPQSVQVSRILHLCRGRDQGHVSLAPSA
jgi:hypothetical protein